MAKYFVHQGLQFQTVSVLPTELGGTGNERVDACTLESVVLALGNTIVTGADAAAQMITIRGWWSETGITDIFQRLSREILNSNGALVARPVRGQGESTDSNLHQLAHEYILPPYLANCISTLATNSGGAGGERARIVVEALGVRHDNVIKHSDADQAWQAWTAYIVSESGRDDTEITRRGYFINPPPIT